MRPDPRSVPDEPGCPDVSAGLDSDDDGTPDSLFTTDDDLLLHTDLDADGLADRTLRLRADGTTELEPCDEPPTLIDVLTRLLRWPGA
ncbi:MAG: hypothetical protein L0I24_11925 [Pseudonocardia sp.]|nr:hypothetical protein [Pseudonocardia sp.]